jgi:hypothetical protein
MVRFARTQRLLLQTLLAWLSDQAEGKNRFPNGARIDVHEQCDHVIA